MEAKLFCCLALSISTNLHLRTIIFTVNMHYNSRKIELCQMQDINIFHTWSCHLARAIAQYLTMKR